ncbi:LapB repeat-containing protein [Listeria monocytogenes]|uniref:LapB repeat-containing protein n=1 Tax=Listeria monocytogenes TaxID=1639 RepID=UPI000873795F|nr:LapB repeat-containing protein [Listeria monocytogenes]EAC5859465.1 LPXTG cell wall anchor domain-containing protein [Listeria monocytogenes]EAD3142809.1 LPXTG cell wall anchor domain-containing protein [Listeria monocytogenes]EAD5304154.1 LPXTG cell wall anchor domain-containing protein [Listeria monocytogenes]EAE5841869.1 LPXTG cell wall anchor domain-containing protein [Listeria monocytogenes]EAV9917792.1 LPXTG cell wall anchor domain-containing protein [Listeria monocytogenes]
MRKMGIKIGLCALLVSPFIIPFSVHVSAEENIGIKAAQDIVNIPDPVLKSYLNSQLGQPSTSDITEAQMDTITNVTISNSSLTDLTGLDYAHNLTLLHLSNTGVTDYALVANIPSLTNLSIDGNNLTTDSLPDLNGLTNITNLNLSPGKLDNSALSKFNKMPNLTYLNLDSNSSITDIMPLKSIPNLATLFVQFCGIYDFRGIDSFPKLLNLSAYGQNVGRTVLINSTIKSSSLNFDEANQTLFVPFTLMTQRSVNFDGYMFPFTTNTGSGGTYFTLNDTQINGSRLSIDDKGITVSGITKDYFDSITKMEYNALYNNPAGSYQTPPSFNSYSVSGGSYDHYFDIDHTLNITSDSKISYNEQTTVTEEQFLTDIHAETDDGTPVTSDFDSIVDLNKPGVYTVTLNAENAGLKAAPKQVTVTILEKPVITANNSITYTKDTTKTAQQFLKDVSAKTSDGSAVTSNFDSEVDLTQVGTYEVTLNAVSADGVQADPVTVLVNVVLGNEPPTPPGPGPDPKPDPNTPAINDNNDELVLSEDSNDTPNKQNKSSDNTTLPNTGDSSQTSIVLIGIILIGIGVIFFRKRKHS